ncbi:type II toxin-antitoxin system death-on-curing family toxin [soil metagenome]
MDALLFLTLGETLELHQRSLNEFGGSSSVRDLLLLESALGMPTASFGGQFLHASLAEMAAAYLFHLVQNHPFVDGNKRTGAAAARVFLLMNGAVSDPSEEEYGDLVLAVASGKADKATAVAFFKQHVQ